ncbi:carboxy terminal-processing peptidase [Tenacibaculum jejuense]|uniref:Peptidase family S41 n=1 Tax=Tenacibaculum jejuense TaxID=584609 RepID=A0A238U8V5_9FLAO|nr:carboxy terminal-processing peptidase [Tenacibaculum jejuense]SNR14840.1 Peptidase family S41 [Tenacibaculum jejuense]
MKMKVLIPILTALLISSNSYGKSISEKNDPEKDKLIIYVLKNLLTRGHYIQKDLNDDFSEHVYNEFITSLDPSKRYFTQKDLKEFSQYKYKIDDQLKKSDISFYKLVYGRFLEKIETAKTTYKGLLANPFNYKKNEDIDVDYDKAPFAEDEKGLLDNWRKQLKLQVISKIDDLEDLQKDKAKKDKKFKKKSFKTLEKEARKEVLKNMDDLYLRIEELENSDWYSTFLNSVVGGFDPHTTYMSPRIKSRFDQDMSGKLEGIGARLQREGMYTKIVELISGGPAWKQGDLEPGDIILEVAQGDGEPLDITGMRLDDAITFIKGKKGTEVRLTVKKKLDGSTKVIPIIRDIVELEETFVKSSVVEKNGKKYGVINLPKFYIDFNDTKKRNAASDMKLEIERLKKENVAGLIVDLRNNGGGSLKTVIDIGGLFIDEGPIVQVKYRGEPANIKNDTDSSVQWAGPLVVMVNEMSASASEIFAAAMQDYGRGVVMGGKQTYGKGTVQNLLPLNYYVKKYPEDLGALKMTIQKFYRINGGSTQIEGVYSDIAMPDRYSYMEFGERDLDGALPWDSVKPAKYTKTDTYSNFGEVVSASKERINSNSKFISINEYAKWLKKNQDDNTISLNYNTYKDESEERVKEAKQFKDIFKFNSNLTFTSPKYEVPLFKKDTVLKDKRMAWHKNLKKDIYLDEALNVLSQLKMKNNYELVKK